ncbi:MAG TPA: polysaccharide biosynthesis tyrosine autokinase [Thermomicrobiales bacterium]|nr:polysaccharide biosynthesis tyrosine autokinase [Thermomicrobiales bacterium]
MRTPVMTNVYVEFIRRWYWIIIIGVIVGVVSTNMALSRQIPVFRSTATVQVGRTIQDSKPELVNLSITDQLVPVYQELARRDRVLNAVSSSLGLPYDADDLRARLMVQQVSGTQLIDIKVVDADPELAAAIANEIARQLVLQGPDETDTDDSQQFVQAQLADLQAKITSGQIQIETFEEQVSGSTSAADVFDAQARLDALNAQVNTWQASYAALIANAEPSKTNFLEVVGTAVPATMPLPRPAKLYYGLGILVGGALAAAIAFALSALFGAIRRAEELRKLSNNVPITTIPYLREIRKQPLVSSSAPASPTAASYRILRNVLQTEQSDAAPVSIAVFSSRPGEGKTTTVANLAIALASVRRNVILVDANVRNPSLDHMFGTDTSRGLSDVVLGECELADALQPTAYPNLTILGAGSIPGNYTDILSPGRVRKVVEAVTAMAEITLIDTPSIQEEQEALMLAKEVDAAIVIVEAGRIRAGEAQRTLAALSRSGVPVLAIALSKARTPRGIFERLPFSRDARLRKLAESRRSARQHPEPQQRGQRPRLTPLNQSKRSVTHAQSITHTDRSKSA